MGRQQAVVALPVHMDASDAGQIREKLLTVTTPQAVTVRLERRAFSPVLRSADLPPITPVPWWDGRPIRYEFA